MMLSGAYSGALLDSADLGGAPPCSPYDLLGGPAATADAAAATSGTAAFDPAAFFIAEPNSSPAGALGAPSSSRYPLEGGSGGDVDADSPALLLRSPTYSTGDLLQELDAASGDFLAPQPPQQQQGSGSALVALAAASGSAQMAGWPQQQQHGSHSRFPVIPEEGELPAVQMLEMQQQVGGHMMSLMHPMSSGLDAGPSAPMGPQGLAALPGGGGGMMLPGSAAAASASAAATAPSSTFVPVPALLPPPLLPPPHMAAAKMLASRCAAAAPTRALCLHPPLPARRAPAPAQTLHN